MSRVKATRVPRAHCAPFARHRRVTDGTTAAQRMQAPVIALLPSFVSRTVLEKSTVTCHTQPGRGICAEAFRRESNGEGLRGPELSGSGFCGPRLIAG